jgi:hypothetical protein
MTLHHRVKALIVVSAGMAAALVAVVAGVRAVERDLPAREPAHAEALYVADFQDDRRLVGLVTNVFVGRVSSQSGTTVLDEFPETQFKVEVLENIKGTLTGTVTVNQQGGRQGDRLVLIEGDALLRPGQVYLFATRPYHERGWHTLVPRYGDLPIGDAQQRASLVARFKKAAQEQLPLMP